MGKRKIQIQQLSNEKTRQLTLAKRKKGLIKKAMELAILCNADVFIQVAGEDKETTLFSSSDLKSMSEIITNDIKKSKKSLLFKEDYGKRTKKDELIANIFSNKWEIAAWGCHSLKILVELSHQQTTKLKEIYGYHYSRDRACR